MALTAHAEGIVQHACCNVVAGLWAMFSRCGDESELSELVEVSS
jgi:hypothetical protein